MSVMKMIQDSGADAAGDLFVNLKRLTRIVLDKLEEGSREGTLDQAQFRLYSSVVMRSLGIWQEALNPRARRVPGNELEESLDHHPSQSETTETG